MRIEILREQFESALAEFMEDNSERYKKSTFDYIMENRGKIHEALESEPAFINLISSMNICLDAMYEDCVETLHKIANSKEEKDNE